MNIFKKFLPGFVALFVFVVFLVYQSAFLINEGFVGIKLRLGQITANNLEPGLHFKVPFIENSIVFDKRLQNLDAPKEYILTKEKKELIVDYFVEWRIKDTQKFYVANRGNMKNAEGIISRIASDDLRGEFAKRTVNEVVSKDRAVIMDNITKSLSREISRQGLEVVDVRVKRVDFSETIKGNVFSRMQSERERVSKMLRAEGKEEETTIKAETDKKVQIIIANAKRDAKILEGQGDAEATNIYAKAFTKDREFYKFQKSLEVYKKSFNGQGNTLITTPDSEFFDYLKGSKVGIKEQ